MPKITLTEARVKALKPRRAAYDIRDSKLRGFGVRVLPSGVKTRCERPGGDGGGGGGFLFAWDTPPPAHKEGQPRPSPTLARPPASPSNSPCKAVRQRGGRPFDCGNGPV